MLPKISSYGRYDNDNYGAHTLMMQFAGMTFYYSYSTIIAYEDFQDGLVCSQNYWGPTTGKHLNWIQPDHFERLTGEAFQDKLTLAIERHIK